EMSAFLVANMAPPDSQAAGTPRAWRTSAAPCSRPGRRSFRRRVVDTHQLQRRLLVLLHRIRDESPQVREALDQFGDALQGEQEKSRRHEQPRRPADQAAGAARNLAAG